MKKLATTFFTLLLLGFSGGSLGQFSLFGASDYDECILAGMKGITSDLAAQAIISSCRAKSPSKKVETNKISEGQNPFLIYEVEIVNANWGAGYLSDYISFDFYNRNITGIKNLKIEVTIYSEKSEPKSYEFQTSHNCVDENSAGEVGISAFKLPELTKSWTYRLLSAEAC